MQPPRFAITDGWCWNAFDVPHSPPLISHIGCCTYQRSHLLHFMNSVQTTTSDLNDINTVPALPRRRQKRPNQRQRIVRRQLRLLRLQSNTAISFFALTSSPVNSTTTTEPQFCCSIAGTNYYLPELTSVYCDCFVQL